MTKNTNMNQEKILIIKLSALGDFIQALGPIRGIRQHHPDAHITLLTTAPFKSFAQQCGYVDTILIDEKPKWHAPLKWLKLRKHLNAANFTRIYDLQNNDRSNTYFKLLKSPKPEWVGTARGASHQNTSPERTKTHASDGHKQTLALAGITNIQLDTLDWLQAKTSHFKIQKPYALLVPGCSPKHPHKRWPADHYAALAAHLESTGIQPVLIGTADDANATAQIAKSCTGALNLTNQTTLPQIATLARGAALAVGNDTGPMHLIAATGIPCLALFSGQTNPIKHAPQGNEVTVIQSNNLKDLTPETVINHCTSIART